MSTPLILGCLWVIVGAGTAMLPMRLQIWPGLCLVITAPILLVWIGAVHGWGWLAFAVFAVGSMMRNPLIHLYRRARGLPPRSARTTVSQSTTSQSTTPSEFRP